MFTSCRIVAPLECMVFRASFLSASLVSESLRTSEKPTIELSGVRMSRLTMLKNIPRALSAARARTSAPSSSAACFAACSSWTTKTCRKHVPTRQPSEVNGVSGHTTWRTIAAAMAVQNMNTIMLRLRTEPWLERAFTSTRTDVSRMNATKRQKATSRTKPVLYIPSASM